MTVTSESVTWGLGLSLFLGGLGLPIPENPLLIGAGYALSQNLAHPIHGLPLWYGAILGGDLALFAGVRWLFSWPPVNALITRMVGAKRLALYQELFYEKGGWTLFLARFTFGIRAAAYVAAGAARYPWLRFMVVDAISVGIQVVIFASIGYFAGDKIEWAKATSETIAVLLTGALIVTLLISVLATALMKHFHKKAKAPHPPDLHPGSP